MAHNAMGTVVPAEMGMVETTANEEFAPRSAPQGRSYPKHQPRDQKMGSSRKGFSSAGTGSSRTARHSTQRPHNKGGLGWA